ncbi:conserved hypothetical protein; putative S-adenosyl-L-methionine (SAM)-dependent methyltransferase domain [Bradyrhizobium sp. ORS 278]|uniref:DUF938 domain-containing protein n=1 Tax=Bradyrhizobium sp. (strain ORS 278) TaxID=114615 RepID=UPI0001508A1A|nr:DUF938 domain-containing protein [Bradyrhizobium sp. ORS 278]CAL80440.1 conserved hypothetical protein; putative S-adenosyl-L-methionine (SAM)-dependent methyltransferase domain [Bradyrhizobium sp. ORS 278]
MAEYVVEFGRDGRPVEPDGRLDAAAFHRNHQPIWAVLARWLEGRAGGVLEAGSGTGQHIVHFAAQRPDLMWWPSDFNANHLASIAAWRKHSRLSNIRDAQRIDLSDAGWVAGFKAAGGPAQLTAIFCANVIHIAPWSVAGGLFAGAGEVLSPDGLLVLYGPFKRDGKHTAVSNAVFDASLREGNPEWGVRDITDLEALAVRNGLTLRETVEMPANNMILVFARAA